MCQQSQLLVFDHVVIHFGCKCKLHCIVVQCLPIHGLLPKSIRIRKTTYAELFLDLTPKVTGTPSFPPLTICSPLSMSVYWCSSVSVVGKTLDALLLGSGQPIVGHPMLSGRIGCSRKEISLRKAVAQPACGQKDITFRRVYPMSWL
jgi:hypothetical protein